MDGSSQVGQGCQRVEGGVLAVLVEGGLFLPSHPNLPRDGSIMGVGVIGERSSRSNIVGEAPCANGLIHDEQNQH